MSALVPQVAPAPQVIPVLQTAPPPQVLFLILGEEAEFNNTHETLISETTTKYTTTHKSNTDDAYNYLLTTKPSAIFVDGGIVFKQNRHLQQLLARYASSGGTIVLSSLFYSNSTEDMMINLVDLFGRFGLCWELGSGHRGAYKLNEVVKPTFGSDNFATLEKRYSMRCIQLLDTPIFSRVYTPAARPAISDLFSPYETGPSPAIFARYGQGFFGFIGDLQNQKGSQSLTLAMIAVAVNHQNPSMTTTSTLPTIFAPANPGCSVCGALTPMLECDRCYVTQYCSTACQKVDWNSHKLECHGD